MEEQWKALRRGWYVGGPTFASKLEKWLEQAVKGRKRESQSGAAKEAHDQAAAERWLARALHTLGLKEEDLSSLPKGAPEKVALAWWLRGRTTVDKGGEYLWQIKANQKRLFKLAQKFDALAGTPFLSPPKLVTDESKPATFTPLPLNP